MSEKTLTKEQEALIPVYMDRYWKIGFSTERIDPEKCKQTVERLYAEIFKHKIVPVLILQSPWECWIAYNMHTQGLEITPASLAKKKKDKKWLKAMKEFDQPVLCGSYDVHTFAFYDFFRDECGVQYPMNDLYNIWRETMNYGYIFPDEEICFVSERPVSYKFNDRKQLHSFDSPAIMFADGFACYSINDVPVPEWLVMTPVSTLSAKKIMAIENVEQRLLGIMKLGAENLISQLGGKVLDTRYVYIDENHRVFEKIDDKYIDVTKKIVYTQYEREMKPIEYQLIEVDIGAEPKSKVLKMQNPSMEGKWHYEFVHDDCKEVMDAIEMRNGERCLPVYLS